MWAEKRQCVVWSSHGERIPVVCLPLALWALTQITIFASSHFILAPFSSYHSPCIAVQRFVPVIPKHFYFRTAVQPLLLFTQSRYQFRAGKVPCVML
jgi:hypothetical protein